MALNSTFYREAQFAQAGLQFLAGNFTLNGSGQPDAAEGKPFNVLGTDLVRSGAGVYVLTVPGRGAHDVLACIPQLEDPTLEIYCVISARDDAARTITFKFWSDADPAAAVDPTANAILHVLLVLKSRPV